MKLAKEPTIIWQCSPTPESVLSAALINHCLNSPKPFAGDMGSSLHAKRATPRVTPQNACRKSSTNLVRLSTRAPRRRAASAAKPRLWRTSAYRGRRPKLLTQCIGVVVRSVRRRRLVSGIWKTQNAQTRIVADSICSKTMESPLLSMTDFCVSRVACAPYAATTSQTSMVGRERSLGFRLIIAMRPGSSGVYSARNAIEPSGYSTTTQYSCVRRSAIFSGRARDSKNKGGRYRLLLVEEGGR